MNGTCTLKEKDFRSSSPALQATKLQKETLTSGSKRKVSATPASDSRLSVPPKRRKIGRNDGSGEGNQNDYFCWLCHKDEDRVHCCELCPRVYHLKCLGVTMVPKEWVCPECEKTMRAQCADTRSRAMTMIIIDNLCLLLQYALDRMIQPGSEAFEKPVDLAALPTYSDYVFYPMDFTTLEQKIKKKEYGCTEAFLADAKWILHNCIIFNGPHHKLTHVARNIIKSCRHEMSEIELCPECYQNSCIKGDASWFLDPCHPPHTLVWAKLKGYPFWPAKALQEANGQINVQLFGTHVRSWVSMSWVFLLSRKSPVAFRNNKRGFNRAIAELKQHIKNIREQFGTFVYPPHRTGYDKRHIYMNIKPEGGNVLSGIKHFKPLVIQGELSAKSKDAERVSAAAKTASALKTKYSRLATKKSTVSNFLGTLSPIQSAAPEASDSSPSPDDSARKKKASSVPLMSRICRVLLTRVNVGPVGLAVSASSSLGTSKDSSSTPPGIGANRVTRSLLSSAGGDMIQEPDSGLDTPVPDSDKPVLEPAASEASGQSPDAESQAAKEASSAVSELPDVAQTATKEGCEAHLPSKAASKSASDSVIVRKTSMLVHGAEGTVELSKSMSESSVLAGNHSDGKSDPVVPDSSSNVSASNAGEAGADTVIETSGKASCSDTSTPIAIDIDIDNENICLSDTNISDNEPDLLMEVDTEDELIIDFEEDDLDLRKSGSLARVSEGQRSQYNGFVKELAPSASVVRTLQRLQNVEKESNGGSSPNMNFASASASSAVALPPLTVPLLLSLLRLTKPGQLQSLKIPVVPPETSEQTPESPSQKSPLITSAVTDTSQLSAPCSRLSEGEATLSMSREGQVTLTPATVELVNKYISELDKSRTYQQEMEKMKWTHQQEVAEIKHNFQLAIAKMKAAWDAEKSKSVVDLKKMLKEKDDAILATIKKQWLDKSRTYQQEMEKMKRIHQQEVAKIKHNFQLAIAEIKTAWDAEQSKSVVDLKKRLKEKDYAILATKRKQWCASCLKEAVYYCCWNTSYCSYQCQEQHWPYHLPSCTQTQTTTSTSTTITTTCTLSTVTQLPKIAASTGSTESNVMVMSVSRGQADANAAMEKDEHIQGQELNIPPPSSSAVIAAAGPDKSRTFQQQMEKMKRIQQEVAEIKRNSQAFHCSIAKMKAAWDAKMSEIVDLKKRLAKEKDDAILATKRKQWCASCLKEAVYYCCWNTSYCSDQCRQQHRPTHLPNCTRARTTTSASTTTTTTCTPTTDTQPLNIAASTGSTESDVMVMSVSRRRADAKVAMEKDKRIQAQQFNIPPPSYSAAIAAAGDSVWRNWMPLPQQTMGHNLHFMPLSASQPQPPPQSQPLQQLQFLPSPGSGSSLFQPNSQCARCQKEAVYYCCWNTRYCSYQCQQQHRPTHLPNCTRARTTASTTTTTSCTPTTDAQPLNIAASTGATESNVMIMSVSRGQADANAAMEKNERIQVGETVLNGSTVQHSSTIIISSHCCSRAPAATAVAAFTADAVLAKSRLRVAPLPANFSDAVSDPHTGPQHYDSTRFGNAAQRRCLPTYPPYSGGAQNITTMTIATKNIATMTIATMTIATKDIATKNIATMTIATKNIATMTIATMTIATMTIATKNIATIARPYQIWK